MELAFQSEAPARGFAEDLDEEDVAASAKVHRIEAARGMNGNVVRVSEAYSRLRKEIRANCVMPPRPGHHPEGRLMALVAPSFSGKSYCLGLLEADPRLKPHEREGLAVRPMVSILAPSPCTLITLGLALLDALGFVGTPPTKVHLIWHAVRRQMIALGVMLFVIDEFHNAITGRKHVEIQTLAAALKGILTGTTIVSAPERERAAIRRIVNDDSLRHPVFLLVAGTSKVRTITADLKDEIIEQVARRSRQIEFDEIPVVRDEETGVLTHVGLPDFVKQLYDAMGFDPDERMTSLDMLKRHCKAGSRQLGRVACILKLAGILSVQGGEKKPPVEYLGDAFEEIYKTGASRNPYLVADVDSIGFPPSPDEVRRAAERSAGHGL